MACSNAGVSTRHSSEEARSARDSRSDKCEFTVYSPTESLIETVSAERGGRDRKENGFYAKFLNHQRTPCVVRWDVQILFQSTGKVRMMTPTPGGICRLLPILFISIHLFTYL